MAPPSYMIIVGPKAGRWSRWPKSGVLGATPRELAANLGWPGLDAVVHHPGNRKGRAITSSNW